MFLTYVLSLAFSESNALQLWRKTEKHTEMAIKATRFFQEGLASDDNIISNIMDLLLK
jgi:hypothetical protein